MGINVIVRGMTSLFLIGIIFFGLMPTIYKLNVDPNLWDGITDSRAIFLKDNALNIFYISGLVFMFGIIIWMFNGASAKGSTFG
jgi:hypothetical protein